MGFPVFFRFPGTSEQPENDPRPSRPQEDIPGNEDESGGKKPHPNKGIFAVMAIVLVIFTISFFYSNMTSYTKNTIDYSQFLDYLERGEITKITIVAQNEIQGILSNSMRFKTLIPYHDEELLKKLQERGVTFTGARPPMTFFQIISSILPWLVTILFIVYMIRNLRGFGGGAFPFTKSKIRSYVRNESKKAMFSSVAGQDEAKYELKEVVEFLRHPEKFEKIGARIPKGVLLVGSPGTGKTLLARACAGEADVNFFYMSGSDFVEMFAGVGASRVRELFEQARKNSPCIVFIDELDAVGRSRSSGIGGGVHDEREQTLNQLLVEMDGFDIHDRIILLAATNRPDVLDKALLRPGRFDRHVVVDMPDLNEREKILALHVATVKLEENINLNQIARATVGCSGADLANLVNEAALFAARGGKKKVAMEDFEEARDKILMGAARKSKVITPEEKLRTARHEAGHALLHLLLKNADPLHKVTIIPRGRALGVAFSLPEKDTYGKGMAYLLDRISLCYGGYVAENMYYDEHSTGVQNDLEQATEIAESMVRDWGMSDLGPISLTKKPSTPFIFSDPHSMKSHSEGTAALVDKEIKNILSKGLAQAEELLSKNKRKLEVVVTELMKHETLLGDQIVEFLKLSEESTTHDETTAHTTAT